MASRPTQPTPQKLRVPRTPLESRQGYHPKKDDELTWRSPPSRQLSREKRIEYESDVRERFYDDYIGDRTTGDARNEVMTTRELSKLRFDPSIYRANAFQGLVYDPARQVPRGLDLQKALRVEKSISRQREIEEYRRRRRMSDSNLMVNPQQLSYLQQLEPLPPRRTSVTTLPSISASHNTERPRSGLQKTLDDSLNPQMAPAVESWFDSATNQEKDIAEKFFRTLSSHGKRPDPASRAALHRTRVKSAVMTPSRKTRQERETHDLYQKMSRDVMEGSGSSKTDKNTSPSRRPHSRRAGSGAERQGSAKGGMFTTSQRQQPSHFTVHPDWASEAITDSFFRK